MEQRQPPFDEKIGKSAKITRVNSVFYLLLGSFLLELFINWRLYFYPSAAF
jgi:hypothetical protein